MWGVVIYYSPKYHQDITHLDSSGQEEYQLDPVIKPKWVKDALLEKSWAQFKKPQLLAEEDILLAHSPDYLQAVKTGTPSRLAESSGLRWVPQLLEASLLSVSGFYEATTTALTDGVSASLSTAFHHARRKRGSGFAVFNGLAIVAFKLLQENTVKRVLVLDCDFHFGDGTISILGGHPNVTIFDIFGGYHQNKLEVTQSANIIARQALSVEEFFSRLQTLPKLINKVHPEIILYNPGVDWHRDDRYGDLEGFGKEELKKRDGFVFRLARDKQTPIAFMLGGGYVRYKNKDNRLRSDEQIENHQQRITQLHLNTFEESRQVVAS